MRLRLFLDLHLTARSARSVVIAAGTERGRIVSPEPMQCASYSWNIIFYNNNPCMHVNGVHYVTSLTTEELAHIMNPVKDDSKSTTLLKNLIKVSPCVGL